MAQVDTHYFKEKTVLPAAGGLEISNNIGKIATAVNHQEVNHD
jgi:hypothetical protein